MTVEPQPCHIRLDDAPSLHGYCDITPTMSGRWKKTDGQLGDRRVEDNSIAALVRRQDVQVAAAASAKVLVGHIDECLGSTVPVQISLCGLVTRYVQCPVDESGGITATSGRLLRPNHCAQRKQNCKSHRLDHADIIVGNLVSAPLHPTLSSAFNRALTASATCVSTAGALAKRTASGFTGVPPSRTSKWTCGPVDRPLEPT